MKKFLIIAIIPLVLVAGAYFIYNRFFDEKEESAQLETRTYDQLGFLIGPSAKEMNEAKKLGAGWIRPHPGPFIWGGMQKSEGGKIDFSETDNLVDEASDNDIQILATIWPYAVWDQRNRTDYNNCRVSGSEFVNEFGWYRCNPNDWEAYEKWVTAFVERYDGDGVDDMPGLKQPIKYWEVFNEPDLQPPSEEPAGLQFYIGEPKDYVDLLYATSLTIKKIDPSAQVLIAGAAGGDYQFLDFYREVFERMSIDSRYPYIDVFDIANVHCISSGDIESFNVQPYKELLDKNGLGNKPIWVTEAEAFISSDPAAVVTQTKLSTLAAFNSGAEKIFYTSRDFEHQPGGGKMPEKNTNLVIDDSLDPSDPGSVFRSIFDTVNK